MLETNDQQQNPLESLGGVNLPIPPLIAQYLPNKDLANLAKANNKMYSIFQPIVKNRELLRHVVRGNKAAVQKMLANNPELLRSRSTAIDCAGNKIINATPYEAALGAGDDDMATMIGSYFSKIEKGEEERVRQYAHYQPHIDRMGTMVQSFDVNSNAPTLGSDFDFQTLLAVFIASPAADVTAALNLDFNHQSPLATALEAMRKHFAPRDIKDGMHFNYANLLEAYKVYAREFDNLERSGNGCDKCDLFWRQVIGYIQRGLPACDRQAFAQGLYYIIEEGETLKRSFDFRNDPGFKFPAVPGGDDRSGLGYKYARWGRWWALWSAAGVTDPHVSKFMSSKNNRLAELMQPKPGRAPAWCVIL